MTKTTHPKPHSPKASLWTRSNRRLRELMHASCFLGPSFLGVLLFFIVPFGVVVWYSVIQGPLNHDFAGLTHYDAVLHNEAFRLAVKNTLIFAGFCKGGSCRSFFPLLPAPGLDTICTEAHWIFSLLRPDPPFPPIL